MDVKGFVLILLLWIVSVEAQNKCCNGLENVLRNKTCKGGENIIELPCKRKYMLNIDTTGNFTVDSEENLVEEEIQPIPKDRYCITKQRENGNDVALVCFNEERYTETTEFFSLRASCSLISVIFLIATTLVYILVPNLRDLQGMCILHSINALTIAMFLLGLLQFGLVLEGLPCAILGYAIFATFLIAFTWLNVVSFHIWKSTVIPFGLGTNKQWYILYCLWGYGLPLVIILSAIIGHHAPGNHIRPEIGHLTCFFSGRQATWAYFYGPIAFLLVINLFLFIWTIKTLWKDMKEYENNAVKIRSMKYKCLLYVKLFFVMGLSWIFEVISFASDNQNNALDYVWMVTDFINGLQGLLIFIVLIACRKRALKGLAKRGFGCFHLPEQWKTLHDEECDELIEEEQLNRNPLPEQTYKSKTIINNSV